MPREEKKKPVIQKSPPSKESDDRRGRKNPSGRNALLSPFKVFYLKKNSRIPKEGSRVESKISTYVPASKEEGRP